MTRQAVSTWAQRNVALGAAFLVCWHLAALADAPRRTLVSLALYGFVLHVVFGKAYSLVPSYFDAQLATARGPALQVPLTASGALLLAAGHWWPGLATGWTGPPIGDAGLATAGAVLWAGGVLAFVGSVAWTLRGNLSGAETATGDANADRAGVDRVANGFVPVAFAYLLAGTYATVALPLGLPTPLVEYSPVATHLLAAGFATLLLFAVGFRLLPRFLVVPSPRRAALVVLPAGAAGPLLLAAGLPAGPLLQAGAVVESVAVVGFAVTVARFARRTERDRVGVDAVLAAMGAGVTAALLGGWMATAGATAGRAAAHLRLNLVGFLGLSIVGVAYQFYPPAVGSHRLASDRTAWWSIAALAGGLALQVGGLLAGRAALVIAGEAVGTAAAVVFAALVVGLLLERGEL